MLKILNIKSFIARPLLLLLLFFIAPNIFSKMPAPCDQTLSYLKRIYDQQLTLKAQELPPAGVEIEAFLPQPFTREEVAQFLEENLKAMAKNPQSVSLTNYWDTVLGRIYEVHIDGKKWVVKTEPSIKGDHKQFIPLEINSPVINTSDDLSQFLYLTQKLRKHFALRTDPSDSGIHVRIDFKNATYDEKAHLILSYSLIEDFLSQVFSTHLKRRKSYSKPLHDEYLLSLLKSLRNGDSLVLNDKLKQWLEFKHYSLNTADLFQAIRLRPETAEFRLFNATLDTEALEVMIQVPQRLVKKIRNHDQEFFSWLEKKNYSIESMLEVLGFDVSKTKPIIERIKKESEKAFTREWEDAPRRNPAENAPAS